MIYFIFIFIQVASQQIMAFSPCCELRLIWLHTTSFLLLPGFLDGLVEASALDVVRLDYRFVNLKKYSPSH